MLVALSTKADGVRPDLYMSEEWMHRPMPEPRDLALFVLGSKTRRSLILINIISWNSSGLGAAVLPEFLLWLDQLSQESRPNIVLIQESHWRLTSEYRHGNWLAYHNGVSEGSTDMLVYSH